MIEVIRKTDFCQSGYSLSEFAISRCRVFNFCVRRIRQL